jgi:hypothetical protein
VSGSDLFVANLAGGGTIGEYTTSGATVNPALISGLSAPSGIALSGSDLFVVNGVLNGPIGEYTTSGVTVNATLISGLNIPFGIALSGSDLFVSNGGLLPGTGTIGAYTTSGATVNPALISGAIDPFGIAVSGLRSVRRERTEWHDRRIHHLRSDGERRANLGAGQPVGRRGVGLRPVRH